jgi:ribosomal protein L28
VLLVCRVIVSRLDSDVQSARLENTSVAFQCEMCAKKTTFKPNLQNVTLMVGGRPTKMRICTRCLRTQHKQAKS